MAPARSGRVSPVAVVLAAVLPLLTAVAGCGLPTPFADDAGQPTSATSAPPDLGRAGRQLSEDELESAFGPAPRGFYARGADPVLDDTVRFRRTDPAHCLDVIRGGDAGRALRGARAGDLTRSWETGQRDTYRLVALRVTTHDAPVGPRLLDDARRALGGCSAFALTGEDLDSRWQAEPLDVAPAGEQTLAVRFVTVEQVDGDTERVVLDAITVRVGHNLLYATQTATSDDPPTEELQTLVADTIERLRD